MILILGLGNPGEKYEATRHNIGFMVINKLQSDWNFSDFEFNKKLNTELSKGQIRGRKILLAKPQTYMNLSGDAARTVMDFYKLIPEHIIVIHDDLDIALGKYKIATDSSSAGHNGVQDIIDKIGTQKFKRLRLGIKQDSTDPPEHRPDAKDYVLQKFSEEELKKVTEVLNNTAEEVKKLL